jgi:hypothetical protein
MQRQGERQVQFHHMEPFSFVFELLPLITINVITAATEPYKTIEMRREPIIPIGRS